MARELQCPSAFARATTADVGGRRDGQDRFLVRRRVLHEATPGGAGELGPELAPHRVSKGTLRFSLSQPVPGRLIARIAKLLAREAAERGTAKRARQKKRT